MLQSDFLSNDFLMHAMNQDLRKAAASATCVAGFGDSDIYLQGNIGQQYLLCYYWMVATLTTNGQVGDMTPKSMLEVSVSRFVLAFCCGDSFTCITAAHTSAIKSL